MPPRLRRPPTATATSDGWGLPMASRCPDHGPTASGCYPQRRTVVVSTRPWATQQFGVVCRACLPLASRSPGAQASPSPATNKVTLTIGVPAFLPTVIKLVCVCVSGAIRSLCIQVTQWPDGNEDHLWGPTMTLPSGPKMGAGWCWRRSPGTGSECSGTRTQPHCIQKMTSNARANTRTTLHQYADHSTVSATQSEHSALGARPCRSEALFSCWAVEFDAARWHIQVILS